ncbi:MAG: GDP-mannose 4,6-dehydratase [Candidatus Staskawiczbacteria bacterium]|nr:GDP-mannose 4,6-dehydratase [Candidatus Staskawiczbacteria bacterium]
MNILITGINGFIGRHLAEYCLKKPNVKVYGTIFPKNFKKEKNDLKYLGARTTLFECDLTDKNKINKVILKVRPDKIFHLAGQSRVSLSWKYPKDTLINNITSDLNLFESVRDLKNKPVVVIAGSSEEYGLSFENELPLREDNPLRPLSPYAVSKVTQEKLAFQYYMSYGLKIVMIRFFNTEGPRRSPEFVMSSFAKQIALIEKGKQKPIIKVGNLSAQRDFTDVRDVVRAYWLSSVKCKFGEPYNVCSGKKRSIKSILDLLISKSKIKNIIINEDLSIIRPSDIPVTVGSNEKFKKQTGWEPKIPFEKTMEDLLKYWREIV